MDTPKHIAIIMDGNGRWAEARGLPKAMGHSQGVESVRKIVKACVKRGVKYLTLYAFSTENWKRPDHEIKALFELLENFIDKEFRLFHENQIRFRVIGEREKIQKDILAKIEKSERETADYENMTVNVAISYGGRQEILSAARALAEDVREGRIEASAIDEDIFAARLYTKGQPDPDLVIRTSGEMRVSNFLLWQISYSEIYVTEKLWPDFGEEDLDKAIEEYSKRERRFGK